MYIFINIYIYIYKAIPPAHHPRIFHTASTISKHVVSSPPSPPRDAAVIRTSPRIRLAPEQLGSAGKISGQMNITIITSILFGGLMGLGE